MGQRVDYTGTKIGDIEVLRRAENTKAGAARWWCLCKRCGNEFATQAAVLKRGSPQSCPDCRVWKGKVKDHQENIYGLLMPYELMEERTKGRMTRWKCFCWGCFGTTIVQVSMLGKQYSCGCQTSRILAEQKTKHGLCGTELYKIWAGIKSRCYNESDPGYPNYGGRGIRMSDEFANDVEAWIAYMGPRPKGASCERIDNDGNYERGNIKWATSKEQARNKRNVVMLTHNNETKPLVEWAESLGMSKGVLYTRIYSRGWSVEAALTTSVSKSGRTRRKRVVTEEQWLKQKARHAVHVETRTGRLVRQSCQYPDCNNPDTHAHHHNGYEQPHWLDVQWFCAKHHPREHEILLDVNGTTKTIKEWSKETGLSRTTIRSRMKSGWSPEEIVSIPKGRGRPGHPSGRKPKNKKAG